MQRRQSVYFSRDLRLVCFVRTASNGQLVQDKRMGCTQVEYSICHKINEGNFVAKITLFHTYLYNYIYLYIFLYNFYFNNKQNVLNSITYLQFL